MFVTKFADTYHLNIPSINQSNFQVSDNQYRLLSNTKDITHYKRSVCQFAYAVSGCFETEKFLCSLQIMMERHDVLRTRFELQNTIYVQKISSTIDVDVQVLSLLDEPKAKRFETAQTLIQQESERPFNLSTGPMVRLQIFWIEADQWLVSFVIQHLVFDGFSRGIFLEELSHIYNMLVLGQPISLKPITARYCDFAEWEKRHIDQPLLTESAAFWTEYLEEVTPVEFVNESDICCANPENKLQSHTLSVEIPSDVLGFVKALRASYKISPFTFFSAIAHALLREYSRTAYLSHWSPSSNRYHPQTKTMLGFFSSSFVLASQVTEKDTVIGLAERFKQTIQQMMQRAPLGLLSARHVTIPGLDALRYAPIQMYVDTREGIDKLPEFVGLSTHKLPNYYVAYLNHLMLTASLEHSSALHLTYNAHRYKTEFVEQLLQRLSQSLNFLTREPFATLEDIYTSLHA